VDRFRVVDRRTLVRLGPPVAFLLAATVAVLLVRSALHHHDSAVPATTFARTIPVAPSPKTTATSGPARSYYRIASGDTFSSVALKFNTTVEQLQALNPGVDPHVLTVGQRIRVR
jgi:LysM repeat protein